MEQPTRRRPPWAWLFLISSSPWLFSSATLIPSPAVQRRTHRRPVLCTASAAEASAAPPTLQLSFDNEALRRLVVDPVPAGPPREVRGAHFVRVEPTPLDSPQLVTLVVHMVNEHGQAFASTFAVSYNRHFYRTLKWMAALPLLLVSLPLFFAPSVLSGKGSGSSLPS